MNFDICVIIFRNLSKEFEFDQHLARITLTLREDLCICIIIFRRILFRIINIYKTKLSRISKQRFYVD